MGTDGDGAALAVYGSRGALQQSHRGVITTLDSAMMELQLCQSAYSGVLCKFRHAPVQVE